jgi:hypothetical protein
MGPAKGVGQLVGWLLFVQLVGLTLPFILLLPIVPADFLDTAARLAPQIRVAVLLLFANGLLTIGIAIAAAPALGEHGNRLGLWFLSVSVVWFSMQAVDNAHILSMLSLSQRYAEAGASNAQLFDGLGMVARSSRRWAHYTELLVIEAWFFVFYGLLFRLSLVPRLLAGFGLVMVVVHAAGITLPAFIGYGSRPALGFSLALSHLALGGWLVAKGFYDQRPVARL